MVVVVGIESWILVGEGGRGGGVVGLGAGRVGRGWGEPGCLWVGVVVGLVEPTWATSRWWASAISLADAPKSGAVGYERASRRG